MQLVFTRNTVFPSHSQLNQIIIQECNSFHIIGTATVFSWVNYILSFEGWAWRCIYVDFLDLGIQGTNVENILHLYTDNFSS